MSDVAPLGDPFDETARWPWVKRYGLSLVLVTLFLTSWVGQFVSQAIEHGNEAREHGGTFEWSDFWPAFWKATFENWQSEFLQVLCFVLLTAKLIHRGSHESREGQDRMEAKVDAILAHVKQGDIHG